MRSSTGAKLAQMILDATPRAELVQAPPELKGDFLDAWTADREIDRLRRYVAYGADKVAALGSRTMLAWIEFRRRIRREASPLSDPRVADLLAVLRGAVADYEALVAAQAQTLADLSPEIANLVPPLPSLAEHIDAAMGRAQVARRP